MELLEKFCNDLGEELGGDLRSMFQWLRADPRRSTVAFRRAYLWRREADGHYFFWTAGIRTEIVLDGESLTIVEAIKDCQITMLTLPQVVRDAMFSLPPGALEAAILTAAAIESGALPAKGKVHTRLSRGRRRTRR